uniref:VCBS domain-containing protein n=1 Tax=Vibrio profundi TaxID=1774960 RepID=UPI00373617A4
VAVNTVGAIGTFDMDEDGNWTFLANSAFDYLNVDDSVTETFYLTSIDGTPSFVKITINGTNDGPVAESFSVDAEDNLIVPIVFDSDVLADDHISDYEDDYDGIPLNIKVTSLPDSGTLLFTDSDGLTREITQTDVDDGTLFDQDSISFVPGAGAEFELGYSGDPEDLPDLVDGFYNWGEEVSPTERLITLDNGNTIGISITDNNNKPLKQYDGQQPHVGYGIGDTDGNGMNMQETLIIDLTDNPLDVVTFGLDGMGGSFTANSSVYVEVVYTLLDGSTHTEQYQKDEGHTGNDQILYEFSYASPDNPIVNMELSSSGGSWELRYLSGNQEITEDVTFDYLVVDSNGAESSTETVSIDVSDAEQYEVHTAENGEELVAQLGNDLLIGNDDSNLFTWLDSTLDSGTDVIKDFEVHNGVSGDLIDLNDLLDDPTDAVEVDALLATIGVDVDGDDVTLTIPLEGGSDEQTIIVEDVVTDLSNPLDDLAVLSDLIKNDAA